jgi:hypothetical protein
LFWSFPYLPIDTSRLDAASCRYSPAKRPRLQRDSLSRAGSGKQEKDAAGRHARISPAHATPLGGSGAAIHTHSGGANGAASDSPAISPPTQRTPLFQELSSALAGPTAADVNLSQSLFSQFMCAGAAVLFGGPGSGPMAVSGLDPSCHGRIPLLPPPPPQPAHADAPGDARAQSRGHKASAQAAVKSDVPPTPPPRSVPLLPPPPPPPPPSTPKPALSTPTHTRPPSATSPSPQLLDPARAVRSHSRSPGVSPVAFGRNQVTTALVSLGRGGGGGGGV